MGSRNFVKVRSAKGELRGPSRAVIFIDKTSVDFMKCVVHDLKKHYEEKTIVLLDPEVELTGLGISWGEDLGASKILSINDIIYFSDESIKINFIHTNYHRHHYYHFINY